MVGGPEPSVKCPIPVSEGVLTGGKSVGDVRGPEGPVGVKTV